MEKENLIKIGVVGPESTGKTILVEQLANYYKTVFVPEFARTYFTTNNINNYNVNTIDFIYKQQAQVLQNMLPKANKILFSDTTALSGKIWAEEKFKLTPELISLELKNNNYNFYLLCNIDIPWVKDEQRKNEHNREALFNEHVKALKEMNANYSIISGKGEERFALAIKEVDLFLTQIMH